MSDFKDKVALVTGASRGVGKGIAMSLGEAGATVYVTGRTVDEGNATVPLAGSISSTADEVTRLGGTGIAVQCDHNNDAEVEAVFARIQAEQGRLDLLVNNVWKGYEGWHTNRYLPPPVPSWERPASEWDDNLIGLRWSFIATRLAAPIMIDQGGGLIINISFGALEPGNPAYNIAKSATDRLALDAAYRLREHRVTVVALYPGLVRTEGVILNAQYFDMSNSESPQYTGRAVVALVGDPTVFQKTGQALVVARLAQEYNFDDIDGKRPTPIQ